jgi:hypothetical protein
MVFLQVNGEVPQETKIFFVTGDIRCYAWDIDREPTLIIGIRIVAIFLPWGTMEINGSRDDPPGLTSGETKRSRRAVTPGL